MPASTTALTQNVPWHSDLRHGGDACSACLLLSASPVSMRVAWRGVFSLIQDRWPRDLHLRAGLGPHLGGQHLFLDRKEWRPTCIAAPLLCPDRLCRWLALLCLVNAGVNRTRSKRVSRGCSLAFIGGFLVALSRCTSFGSLVLVAYTAVCPLSLWRWVPMRVGFTPFDGGRCAFGLPIQDVDPAL